MSGGFLRAKNNIELFFIYYLITLHIKISMMINFDI